MVYDVTNIFLVIALTQPPHFLSCNIKLKLFGHIILTFHDTKNMVKNVDKTFENKTSATLLIMGLHFANQYFTIH